MAWSPTGFAGSDPATRGSMTARHFQPLEQVGAIMEGISLDAEAGAQAADIDDLFERLEASGRLVRIDPSWPATMFRGTMLSAPRAGGPAANRRCRQARPGAPHRARPDRPRARGVPKPALTSCMWIALRSASTTPPPSRSSSPVGSWSSRCGTSRRHSTLLSSASSRPTGTTMWTRTGFAHLTRTPAASMTGRA